MMSSGHRRRLLLAVLSFLGGACSAPKADPRAATKDPGAPAVVQTPRTTVPYDTIKRPTLQATALDEAKFTIASDYAILGAAISFGDVRTIASSFSFDAEVITPDTTYKGIPAIVRGLGRLASGSSLREFQRKSLTTKVVDSTVMDSGTYVLKTKRAGADSVLETGRYATMWRIVPPPRDWVITRDHLYPDARRKGR